MAKGEVEEVVPLAEFDTASRKKAINPETKGAEGGTENRKAALMRSIAMETVSVSSCSAAQARASSALNLNVDSMDLTKFRPWEDTSVLTPGDGSEARATLKY